MFVPRDWDKFAIDLFQGGDKLEYNTVVKMTQDLVILELVHRIVVCAFEVSCLHRFELLLIILELIIPHR